MRSMVEGAFEMALRFRCRRFGESRAPSTALRAVPLPRYRGAGKYYAARTREKKVATLVSRSFARDDRREVHCVMSSTAAAPPLTACSTEAISAEARVVCPAAV